MNSETHFLISCLQIGLNLSFGKNITVTFLLNFLLIFCGYWLILTVKLLTVCSCHVTYAFESESTLYSCLNVKELLARSRREI